MKMRTRPLYVTLIATLLMSLLAACGGPTPPQQTQPEPELMDRVEYTGEVTVPEAFTVDLNDLSVMSILEESPVGSDGAFHLGTLDSEDMQMHFVSSNRSGNTILIGLYDANTGESEASAHSTALALLLANPLLLGTPRESLIDFRETAVNVPSFQLLVDALDSAYAIDAELALDETVNPHLFQLAHEVFMDTVLELAGETPIETANSLNVAPFIEDISGSTDIRFVNPRHAVYGASVQDMAADAGAARIAFVSRKERVIDVEFEWAFPPIRLVSDPAETVFNLGNGYFQIELTRGDPLLIAQPARLWNTRHTDAEALATIQNTAVILEYILELFIGHHPAVKQIVTEWPSTLKINASHAYALTTAMRDLDITGIIGALASIIDDNSDAIADELEKVAGRTVREKFVNQGADLLRKLNIALFAYDAGNQILPFVFDLLFAPNVTYLVSQTDGLISFTKDDPPVAAFSVTPGAGVVGTVFTVDASSSTDDIRPHLMEYRWDFDGDGSWDTDWSAQQVETISYGTEGSRSITLEVRDAVGQTGTASRRVNVGGAGASAQRVLLFMDNLPWDSNATLLILEELGIPEGTGPGTYQIVSSDEMRTFPMDSASDLIIIANDQHQGFYDNYAANELRFVNFVVQGGTLFWGASDAGWASGYMSEAGVDLPGNVTTTEYYSYWNYLVDPALPLTAGLKPELHHNYASHESFGNLPPGTTVYLVDENNGPTLIEFNLGLGWVIMSGLPMEHQYVHTGFSTDLVDVAPRILTYVLGLGNPAESLLAPSSLSPGPAEPSRSSGHSAD